MSVTASKLGQAPITIDWQNLMRVPSTLTGGGSTRNFEPDPTSYLEAWGQLKERFQKSEVGFYDSPKSGSISQASASQSLADKILASSTFSDALFLGIGGSALGPIALLDTLRERCRNKITFHFVENPDPDDWRLRTSNLNPAKTLVVLVTKSGGTYETIAQALLALEWLGKARWKSHVVALTDPEKGDLRAFAKDNDLTTLDIAPSIGGRFSIFSPVGLFPAALAGLNTQEFMLGATQVRDFIEKSPPEKNPIFILGDLLLRHATKRTIHVCMPYATLLRTTSNWFVQLWGESLGKDGKGFTPLAALGATDQHSILQLLRDGPDDKITWFITVDSKNDPIPLPRTLPGIDLGKYASFSTLSGQSLKRLMQVEYEATSKVLTNQGRPHLSIKINEYDERSMGALFFMLSALTAFTGTLWGVNPFDQPGVEEGKGYIKKALSQGGDSFSSSNSSMNSNDELSDSERAYQRLRQTREDRKDND